MDGDGAGRFETGAEPPAPPRTIRARALVGPDDVPERAIGPALADPSPVRMAVVERLPQRFGQSAVQAVFDAVHRAGLTFSPETPCKTVATFLKGW